MLEAVLIFSLGAGVTFLLLVLLVRVIWGVKSRITTLAVFTANTERHLTRVVAESGNLAASESQSTVDAQFKSPTINGLMISGDIRINADRLDIRQFLHGDSDEIATQYGEQSANLVRMASDPDALLASSHLAEGLDSLFRTLGPPPTSQAGDAKVVLIGDGGGKQ
ncbi:hypothetical protein ACFVUH_24185 [Kitasatospora sp. NPDC058032]|uniref:hypothetical protein n=1 Tax=Kitasatospora sp. NPDC058032 TaxID=3346307 RepID=UPI0036DE9BB0